MCCQLPRPPPTPTATLLAASSISINKTMKQEAWLGRRGRRMFGCYVT